MKKLLLGSDHAGFHLKQELKAFLKNKKIPFQDLGPKTYNPKDDYPDFAKLVAKKVIKNKTKGVLICGNAEGICIAANKIKGARAAVLYDNYTAKTSRLDDNANIACLRGRKFPHKKATKILLTFLKTKFSNKQRHKRRIKQIKKLETK